jgi:hypothetical protein
MVAGMVFRKEFSSLITSCYLKNYAVNKELVGFMFVVRCRGLEYRAIYAEVKV